MNLQTVKCFAKAMRFGSKYIYQTVPRLLTLWLDMADEIVTKPNDLEQFRKINQEVQRAARVLPAWKVSVHYTFHGRTTDDSSDAVVHRFPPNRVSSGTEE